MGHDFIFYGKPSSFSQEKLCKWYETLLKRGNWRFVQGDDLERNLAVDYPLFPGDYKLNFKIKTYTTKVRFRSMDYFVINLKVGQ